MQNRLGINYKTLIINFHSQTHGDNEFSRPTVNVAFRILQPKMKKTQKIQQGTKNEGKRKEERYRKTKQWLIMLNKLPQEK